MGLEVIWIAFFAVLIIFGFGVVTFPRYVARLVGRQQSIQEKSAMVLLWRGLGGLVLTGSVVDWSAFSQ